MIDCSVSEHEDIENFVIKQLQLLDIERNAEIEENKCLQENSSLKILQRKGLCVPKLRVINISPGLFGRILIKFQPPHSDGTISTHTISSGDIVGIGNSNSEGKISIHASGVVLHVHDSYITIALEKDSDSSEIENNETFSLIKLANDVTYKRLKRVLKFLQSNTANIPLVNILFGFKHPSVLESISCDSIHFNENLNDTQKEAVNFALSQKEVAVLHGPPGTGKTTTLVECILQCMSRKLKIIACAPSNVAVDNLVEKLATHKVKMVRLGHPARVHRSIQKYSLDSIISLYEGSDVIDDMHLEISKLKNKIENAKNSTFRKSLWAQNKNLIKEMKERQKSIVQQVLSNADIVLSTLTSASDDGPLKHLEKHYFDVCVIDECSQALEMACWIPLRLAKKCIIAGDHNQLPPTILSEKAAKDGLSVTLMERLLKLYGESIMKMLTVQYRMHELIMLWPSKQLYENKLLAHESVQSHLLYDLPEVANDENTSIPLLLIDTAGCDLYESQAEEEESKGNEGEADIVSVHVQNLIKAGVKPSDIAIITPYNFQVDLIKLRCFGKYPKLEIKSVDGFQGREKEAVILSLVRSNDDGEVGFLSENRRINVAITRAKRHLAVICNTSTVSHSEFLKSFISYCEEKGEVRSAFQYENLIGQYPVAMKSGVTKSHQQSSKPKKKNVSKSTSALSSKDELKRELHEQKFQEVRRFSTEEKYRKIIEDFMNSRKDAFSFSPELSAFERKIVHELSEELGLVHVSQGEAEQRCINISKPIKCGTINNTDDLKSATNFSAKKSHKNENMHDEQTSVNEKNKAHKDKKCESKQSCKSNPGTSFKNVETEDFDALIAEVVKSDKTCCFENCKKCVAILSQVCQFCRGRFCFSHFIPEAHGCGHLAKAHARSQIRKTGAIYAGSGKPEKKVDPIKHSHLQKKLNDKINSMTNQRKMKQKN